MIKSIKTLITLIFFSVAASYLWGADVLSGKKKSDAEQRTLVIVDADYTYDLNPHTANYTTEAQLLTGLYEGLFSYNPTNLEPEYALCSSYKISRDQKRWTFTLRKDAKFSNGDAITAQSVKDSWLKLLANPDASFSSMIDCVSGAAAYRQGKGTAENVRISVKDNETLVVHLDYPVSQLTRILCHHSFAVVSEKPDVYSGPFVLKSHDKKSVEMVRNENYWDAESVALPGIKILKSENELENANLINIGKADWVSSVADVGHIINSSSICVGPEFGTFYFFFKIKNKPWNNPEFRRALLEAVPYDKLRKGSVIAADTLVYPLVGYPKVAGLDDYDVDDAIVMMNAARKKAGIPLDQKLPLIFAINDSKYMREYAEILKEAWEPLGVNVIIQTTPAQRYMASIDSWNADLFYYSWIGDYADPMAFLELFRGYSSLNESKYANKVFDGYLNQAALTSDPSERYKLLGAAEEKLLQDGVIIPIYHPVSFNVINTDSIGGWSANALDLHPLKYLYIKRNPLKIPNLI